MSNLNLIVSTGKRKKAVATAIIKPGNGKVKVNGVPVEIIPNTMARVKIMEPILLVGKEIMNLIDIEVRVSGGGVMGQASASRTAIARGLISFFRCNESSEECKKRNEIAERIKQIFEEYDRTMLSGDYRRTEPEKYMRYSARRGWQTSYR
ncbi:MAG: 30S ribosomal protein S9 [Caldisphaera sp.]|uniref:30S ribosomal protein S9 n=1 Tax=Caldisphaera sp. TaxID=2060322 RepID=UPI00397AB49A